MTYVIQASPLTKIFLPEWEQKCVDNPQIIGTDMSFEVMIPRSAGAILLTHNKPVHISKLINYAPNRKIDGFEAANVVAWLTDPRSEETDLYGVVAIDIESSVSSTISNLMESPDLLSDDPKARAAVLKKQADMQAVIVAKMKASITDARERANERVKRQLKITHRNLIKQWENNQADGKGTYPPSATEALGAYILSEEIKKASSAKQAMIQNLNNLISQTKVG